MASLRWEDRDDARWIVIEGELDHEGSRELCTSLRTATEADDGAGPVVVDLALVTFVGSHALRLLLTGREGRMVVMRNGTLSDADLLAATNKQRLVPLDHPLVTASRAVRTCFGD